MAKQPKNILKEGMGLLRKKAATVNKTISEVADDLAFTAKDTANDVKAYVDEHGGLDKIAESAAAKVSKTVTEATRAITKNVKASVQKNRRKDEQGS